MEKFMQTVTVSESERTELESELVVQQSLADQMLASAVNAHMTHDNDVFDYASSIYEETRARIRGINYQLYPWLKKEKTIEKLGGLAIAISGGMELNKLTPATFGN